jgi:AraC family transcriptional regulator
MDRPARDNIGMQFFRPQSVSVLTMRDGRQGLIGMARVQGRADPKPLDPHHVEDAFLFVLSQSRVRSELTFDGHAAEVTGESETKVTAYDYRHRWTCVQHTDFDLFNWHVPRSAFDVVAPDYRGGAAFADLVVRPGVNVDDPAARRLAALLAPAFDAPATVSNLFVDHVSWAAVAHFAHAYGEFIPLRPRLRPQLSDRQLRIATDMIAANLAGDARLADLARACGLSVSYFARAFRNSTGLPPHRWLLQRRVEHAQLLLRHPAHELAQVAVACGFYDQSHLAKVFKNIVGASPADWRRRLVQ